MVLQPPVPLLSPRKSKSATDVSSTDINKNLEIQEDSSGPQGILKKSMSTLVTSVTNITKLRNRRSRSNSISWKEPMVEMRRLQTPVPTVQEQKVVPSIYRIQVPGKKYDKRQQQQRIYKNVVKKERTLQGAQVLSPQNRKRPQTGMSMGGGKMVRVVAEQTKYAREEKQGGRYSGQR